MYRTRKEHRKGLAVAVVAARQHGIISRRQLRELGLSDEMIATRVENATLHRLFRGVFAVGHRAIGRKGTMLAAVLSCGERSVISHGSAAELLGLWDRHPHLIDVSGLEQRGRKIQGLRYHRASSLSPDETTIRDGVPCTTVSRTLVDLAAAFGSRSLRGLIEQAAVLRQLDVGEIDRLLSRRRRRGAPALRAVLAPWRGQAEKLPRLRSRLESRLLPALVEAGLPGPRCNVRLEIEGRILEVDMIWEGQRLVVARIGRMLST